MTEPHPDDIRREIARTRAQMDRTLAMIEDRVSPTRIKERQLSRVRGRWERARTAVMGSPDDGAPLGERAEGLRERAGEGFEHATEAAREAPDRIQEATRGNPLAAGVIAFGLGALAGGAVPATRQEQRLASDLRENLEEPVREELQQVGATMQERLREPAEQALEDTKETARSVAQRTGEEARDRTQDLREGSERAAGEVRGQER